MSKLRELVTELMIRDEPAFITQRVDNFFQALEAAGYEITHKPIPHWAVDWQALCEPVKAPTSKE